MSAPIEACLLAETDPRPVMRTLDAGTSPYLLVCDHAGNAIPAALGDLGLAAADLEDHIAIDIGAFSFAHWLAQRLDAALIGQAYSRLVIDCNRRPGIPASTPETSDGRTVPANQALNEAARQQRVDAIFRPYHEEIAGMIDARRARGRSTILVAIHSFTRTMNGARRPWDIGVMHGPAADVAHAIIDALADSGLVIGRNEPYAIDFDADYTLPVHGEAGDVPYVEIEVCQDLVRECAGQRRLAKLLALAFGEALHRLEP